MLYKKEIELINEFKLYLMSHQIEIDDSITLESFWANLATSFKHLPTFALRILRIPVSSAVVERSFSIYRHVFTDLRTNLKQENVSGLVMLAFNKRILS